MMNPSGDQESPTTIILNWIKTRFSELWLFRSGVQINEKSKFSLHFYFRLDRFTKNNVSFWYIICHMEREILKKPRTHFAGAGPLPRYRRSQQFYFKFASTFWLLNINTHLLKQFRAYFLGSPLGRGMSHLRENFQLHHLNSIFIQGRPLFRIKHIAIIS